MASEECVTHSCVGVIFQFSADGVCFEFTHGDTDDAIGIVKPTEIIINTSGDKIPAKAAVDAEQLSAYIQAGDELRVTVEQRDDLPVYSYVEDEEEEMADGTSSKVVEIQPKWLAKKAELVNPVNIDSGKDEVEDEEEAEADEEEMDEAEDGGITLDYEEDILFLEDEDIDDIAQETGASSAKKPAATKSAASASSVPAVSTSEPKKADDKMAVAEPETMSKAAPSPPQHPTVEEVKGGSTRVTSTTEPKSTTSTSAPIDKPEETFIETARIVQLKKPPKGSDMGRVSLAIIEITSGKFAGRRVTVNNSSMWAWGHHLVKANLMINVQYGDVCEVEYRVGEVRKSDDDAAAAGETDADQAVVTPIIKQLWIGAGRRTTPAWVTTTPDFGVWLANRSFEEKDFIKWVRNQLPPKPYFPFQDDVYSCKVIGFLKDEKFVAQGVFVEVADLVKKADGSDDSRKDGNIIKLSFDTKPTVAATQKPKRIDQPDLDEPSDDSNGKTEGNATADGEESAAEAKVSSTDKPIALLMQEDFYVCGVCVQNADLRMLLRAGDEILCQIQPVSRGEKRRLKKELAQCTMGNVSHMAYLGYVGPKRPKQANLTPMYAPFLDKFLQSKGLTIDEFEAMRYPAANGPETVTQPNEGFFQPPPMMGFSPFAPRHPGMMPFGVPQMMFGQRPGMPVGMPQGPNALPPGVSGAPFIRMVPIQTIGIATNLAARAINLPSATDLRVRTLINDPAEVDAAFKLIKVLTQALTFKMQTSLANNIAAPKMSELNQLALKAKAAETVLSKTEVPTMAAQQATDLSQPPPNMTGGRAGSLPPASVPSAASLTEQFKEVQEKLLKEAEAARAASAESSNKAKNPIVRDMKKVLQSYKADKVKESAKSDVNPLELLREFTQKGLKIRSDAKTIWFGEIGFPKTCKTNYKATIGDSYYTLNALYYFLTYGNFKGQYNIYFRAAQKDNVQAVQVVDREKLHRYLTTKCDPPTNVKVQMTHRDLNPELYADENASAGNGATKRAGSVPSDAPSKLARMDEQEIKARAQMQLLSQQQAMDPSKRASRFDQPPPPFGQTQNNLEPIPVFNPMVQAQHVNPMIRQQQAQPVNPMIMQQPPTAFGQVNPMLQQDPHWTSDSRRSPTFERMAEIRRSRSPSFGRSRSPSMRTDVVAGRHMEDPRDREFSRQRSQASNSYDPFHPTESPPPKSAAPIMNPFMAADPFRLQQQQQQSHQPPPQDAADADRQKAELEQQRLWEEFKREREAKKRRQEEEELHRARLEEERVRDMERARLDERERLRLEDLRLKLAEEDRLRQLEEKRRLLDVDPLVKERDQERLWKQEMDLRLRREQELQDNERRRLLLLEQERLGVTRSTAPPPKIDSGYASHSSLPVIDIASDDEDDSMSARLRQQQQQQQRVPPPPPRLSNYNPALSVTAKSDQVKAPWAKEPEMKSAPPPPSWSERGLDSDPRYQAANPRAPWAQQQQLHQQQQQQNNPFFSSRF